MLSVMTDLSSVSDEAVVIRAAVLLVAVKNSTLAPAHFRHDLGYGQCVDRLHRHLEKKGPHIIQRAGEGAREREPESCGMATVREKRGNLFWSESVVEVE